MASLMLWISFAVASRGFCQTDSEANNILATCNSSTCATNGPSMLQKVRVPHETQSPTKVVVDDNDPQQAQSLISSVADSSRAIRYDQSWGRSSCATYGYELEKANSSCCVQQTFAQQVIGRETFQGSSTDHCYNLMKDLGRNLYQSSDGGGVLDAKKCGDIASKYEDCNDEYIAVGIDSGGNTWCKCEKKYENCWDQTYSSITSVYYKICLEYEEARWPYYYYYYFPYFSTYTSYRS